MPEPVAEKGVRMALFIMLILGTLLHGISVAHIYLPALAKVGSLIALMMK